MQWATGNGYTSVLAQGKRCDKKSLVTIRTECQSCLVTFGIKCPDGYTKITNGTVGIRDCRKDSVEQPVKSALLTTYLGPAVQQCAAVCMEYATVEYTVMGPVSATLGTLAATVMSVKEFLLDSNAAQYFVKLHIIAGQMSTEQMNNTDTFYTLTGKSGEIFSEDKDNQLKLKLYEGKKKVKIIQGNILASNGLLHILDRAMDKVVPTFESNTELEVATLISTPHIRSMANQIIRFNTTNEGQILVNGMALEEMEVAAKNGRIYTLRGVLIPPSIIPILPHRCDETKREMRLGTCVSCSMVYWSKCPADSEPTTLFVHKCIYPGRIRSLKNGCARYCNATVKCADGLDGNGTCVCQDGFRGSRCQFCSDPSKYGPRCDKTCPCIFGTCDNRIDSDGACLPGTCRNGSVGRFCHKQTSVCGPYVQFCHIHATCEYSDGTASCVCKPGYEGDGSFCVEMDPCSGSTPGGCSRYNECECKKGFRGNGIDCEPITSCLEQTEKCHPLATCQLTSYGIWSCVCQEGYEGDGLLCYGNAAVNASLQHLLSTTSNLTVLVPSRQAIEDMDQEEKAFWLTKSNIPILIKYHTLLGTYGVADLQALSPSDMLATSLQGNFLHLVKADGNITIGGASVIDGDNAATNGVIHIINKQYNLATAIEAADAYTVFAPNNDAIESYIREKKVTTLEEDILRYHVVLEEKLLKNDLHNGMHRETMLGFSYLLGFFLRDDQLYVNEAPINYTNVATDKGVIHGLGKVLEIQKNRCDINDTTIVRTRECCAGYFGPQCQPCPGKPENVCFGNGICLDGANGTGACECGRGFSGTACETCAEGKYGVHCDQECTCVHGRCSQGPLGDGACDCDVGWRGVKCDSEITKDNCNGTCHTSANCLLNPDGTALCKCAAGFQGNGTVCTAINACEISNGGCSAKAICKRTTPGSRVCVCKAGYTGDGIVCIEINPCLENHGGCHRHAECTQTGPNQAVCNCLPKYTGDGKVCTLINVCLTNNGGCSEFAICNHTGQDERTCTCKPNYIGDGFTCRGNIHQEHSVRDLIGPGPFTVLAPLSAAFDEESQIKDWDKGGLMPQILRYHVIACHQLLLENLKLTPNATSLQGESLVISVSQDMVLINNKARIISSDIICTNGIIHVIDKLLSPQNLLITPRDASGTILQNLTTVAMNHGYGKFSNLIQDSGLLSVITNPIHTPVTLFWPSDQALQALPREQQDFLFNQDNQDKLKEYLKFHVIRDAKVLAVDLPRSATWKTLQGSELSVKCGAGSDIGDLFLNSQTCRIVQRELLFDLGVAYGIDCLLIDPTLGGRCDTFTTFDVSGQKRKCLYDLPFKRNLEGCRQLCTLVIQLPKCCKGYFWPDCQACPGGPDTPCNNRGVCLDQYSPSRQCKCNSGFNGTACELCWPGRFGPDCQPCGCSDHGQCDDGITGSGECLCETGWTGRFCDAQTALPPVCMPPCSAHATCKTNNTCECNLNYEGDGITCTVVDFCKQNNGGCAKVAKCSQKGTKVSCSCQKGYQGDGHSCTAIDPCADGLNGRCHEHATCKMTGPGKHKCECKSHYVGDGLDCEPEQLPLDRCLQDNGQCHANADCADLHFQDTTVGVFHLRSPLGQYKLTFDKAREACAQEAATMATYNQLSYAQKAKYHLCSAGWLDSGRVAYPTSYASQNCGSGVVGIVDYGPRNNKSEMWDVFCYRMKDVNCTCKVGYVGDGFSCSGNLLQVLMSFPSLTNFLKEVLAYSNSSARGRAFLKHLTDLSIRSTLFVPQNSGLGENETRFVDGRAILQWDIFASNGIIHVISKPLKAPSGTSGHTGLGTGVFFAIILVIGAIALAAYSYFRLNRRTIGFQHFESEEDIDVAALGKQQPENISNPMYESTTSATPEPSYDPFTDIKPEAFLSLSSFSERKE
ncbi:hypothetical protein MJT46_002345 [Ovis ammon polii x Ovis aries]|nr:hypothetical protein MJT46_002345 [Ovis ammon polii x Ovis aries]